MIEDRSDVVTGGVWVSNWAAEFCIQYTAVFVGRWQEVHKE